jgi:tRNA (guanine9-N1)-methyltransferase
MLKWLECGDWGTAFMRAIPPRKGGRLKVDEADAVDEADENAMSSNLKTQQPVHGESTSSDCGAHDKQGTADAGQEDVEKAAEGTHP